jgi:hypothetical protein
VHRWAFISNNVDMVRLLFMYHNITDPTPNPSPTRDYSLYTSFNLLALKKTA